MPPREENENPLFHHRGAKATVAADRELFTKRPANLRNHGPNRHRFRLHRRGPAMPGPSPKLCWKLTLTKRYRLCRACLPRTAAAIRNPSRLLCKILSMVALGSQCNLLFSCPTQNHAGFGGFEKALVIFANNKNFTVSSGCIASNSNY